MPCFYCKNTASVIRKGSYRRPKDQRLVERFFCKSCQRGFSSQTYRVDYRHRKAYLNHKVFRALTVGVSQRACAYLFGVKWETIARRVVRFGEVCEANLDHYRATRAKAKTVQFDELETFEHTKLKPLTVPIAVEKGSRKILALGVGKIAAKGHLAALSRKKYGPRTCERKKLLDQLLQDIKGVCSPDVHILTDKSQHYPSVIQSRLPQAKHSTTKGRRGCVVGQGELKRGGFDPLFSLNHSCAMFRDNLKTLSRRTWCTVKRIDRLRNLLYIYAWAHNLRLELGRKRPKLFRLRHI